MQAYRGLPQYCAGLGIEGDHFALLACADHYLSLRPLYGRRREDRGGFEIVIKVIMGRDLLIPEQLSGAADGQFRVGIQVGPGSAGAIRILRGARHWSRVARAPVGRTGAGVQGGGIPGAAAAIDLWIAPQVAILDGVERPLDSTRSAHRRRRGCPCCLPGRTCLLWGQCRGWY